ncbi:MAG: MBL-fold metallo-hydrolase superfamily [Rhodanobacteraceae bacterium]|jgi:glyoxylase-like metal-dependent hydrolase (beta-lactamase superfamily II)|nr:MAG: MBL-fold metallo-hydrolase superfamily [Rhodanobacteraceae bacterium]
MQTAHTTHGAGTAQGIHIVDTGFQRPQFDAAYLIVENGRAAFIDCGTQHSQPRLLAALAQAGLSADDVDWLILTHVHLDHAGGAGELMARLPNAKLVVHPRGARHMIDPSILWAGAAAVYGEEEMRRSYGSLKPVPAERVVEAPDGHVVDLAGRALRCLDTPGHAKHHNAILDARSGCIFSGDTFGLSYREFDSAKGPFIIPTTSPVQFDPEALHASIRRLVALQPPAIYLTHFGPVTDVHRLGDDLHATIDAMVELAQRHARDPNRHAALTESIARLYVERVHAHGCTQSPDEIRALLAIDIELNAQGLEVWLAQSAGRGAPRTPPARP